MIRLIIFPVLQLVLVMILFKYLKCFTPFTAPPTGLRRNHSRSLTWFNISGLLINTSPPALGNFDRSIQGNQIIPDQWNTQGVSRE